MDASIGKYSQCFRLLLCSVDYVGTNHLLLTWICFMDMFCMLFVTLLLSCLLQVSYQMAVQWLWTGTYLWWTLRDDSIFQSSCQSFNVPSHQAQRKAILPTSVLIFVELRMRQCYHLFYKKWKLAWSCDVIYWFCGRLDNSIKNKVNLSLANYLLAVISWIVNSNVKLLIVLDYKLLKCIDYNYDNTIIGYLDQIDHSNCF
jgi:hypothetical protein